jgi:hypothetical protein
MPCSGYVEYLCQPNHREKIAEAERKVALVYRQGRKQNLQVFIGAGCGLPLGSSVRLNYETVLFSVT